MGPATINNKDDLDTDSSIHFYFNQYTQRVPLYEKLVAAVHEKCRSALLAEKISNFSESRVKEPSSLWKKLLNNEAEYSSLKDIEDGIMDACGLRIIFHYMTDQRKIKSLIESIFDVQEVVYHQGSERISQRQPDSKWGYELEVPDYVGTHFRCFAKLEKLEGHLGELSDEDRTIAANTRIEIQVRSMMDDIWARYSHPIYKLDQKALATHSESRPLNNFENFRLSLEMVRKIAIGLQKEAEKEEEKNNRKFQTKTEVWKYFRKLMKTKFNRDLIDESGAKDEALKGFLESIDRNTPSSLNSLMEEIELDFSEEPGSDYERIRKLYQAMEFNVVLYLIDRVLLDMNGQSYGLPAREALSAKSKMEIILSTFLWMEKLLHSRWVWRSKLTRATAKESTWRGLNWLSEPRQRGVLTAGRELDKDGEATLDGLWSLFESHTFRPIKLAFTMSRSGMIRNVVSERDEAIRIIQDLLDVPTFRR